jgi:hypothetical protein
VTLSQFRQNVQDTLAAGLGVTMVPGLLDGPNQFGEWRGSVYVQRVQEDPSRVAEEQLYLIVRVFAPFSSEGVISPNNPYDPTPLEDMVDKLQQVVAANQTGLGAWYQRITAVEIDPVNQGLQATVFAYTDNQGVEPLP